MILVLSGEGPTDLGRCNTGSEQCQDKAFDIGPMAVITDKLIEEKIGYSLRSIPEAIHFVSKKSIGCMEQSATNASYAIFTGLTNTG